MKPVLHPSNTRTLDAPKHNATSGKIVPIGITDVLDGGIPYVVSFWQPSAGELECLQHGGSVSLWLLGQTMPVTAISVDGKKTIDSMPHIGGFDGMDADRRPAGWTVEEWNLGSWLAAALDDPKACAEFKRDIQAWFDMLESRKK
jgi:hypothetical protein